MKYYIIKKSVYGNRPDQIFKEFSSENQAYSYLAKMQEEREITGYQGEECRGGKPTSYYHVVDEQEYNENER